LFVLIYITREAPQIACDGLIHGESAFVHHNTLILASFFLQNITLLCSP